MPSTAQNTLQITQILEDHCIGEHIVDLGHDGSIRIQNAARDGQECVTLTDGEVAALKEYLLHL